MPSRLASCFLSVCLLGFLPCACVASPSEELVVVSPVGSQTRISLPEMITRISGAKLIWVGESHDDASHHALQLAVIKAMHAQGRPFAVGLEMMRADSQDALNSWVAGTIDETLMSLVFADNWSLAWPLYRDIFVYCRDQRIPMIGLNVPKGITRKVAREGISALSEQELGLLPPLSCDISPAYRAFLLRLTGAGMTQAAPNPHGDKQAFERFCEAQSVWDAAFAAHALAYLAHNPDASVVILCGGIHAWKQAGAARAQRLQPDLVQSVLQPAGFGGASNLMQSPEDADYLLSFAP